MIRAIAFLVVTVSYLWFLDCTMYARRVFTKNRTGPYIDRSVQSWSRMVVALMGLFLNFKVRDFTGKSVRERLPEKFIVISNHQSLIDILIVFCFFPKHQMRFVAKKSLGRWFPGVSATLRFQKHALISRNSNPKETVALVTRLGRRAYGLGHCPIIFPEGTRSRTGELGTFHTAGLRMMLDPAPMPLVVMAIDGGSKLSSLKSLLGPGRKEMRLEILDIVPSPKGKEETKTALDRSKERIAACLSAWRST